VRLTRLHLRNFKSLNDATFRPKGLTLIIGANGAGKTSVLQAIELLGSVSTQAFGEKLDQRGWNFGDLATKGSGQSFGITAVLESPQWGEVTWAIEFGKLKHLLIARETITDGSGADHLLRRGASISRLNSDTNQLEKFEIKLTSSVLSTISPTDNERFPLLWAVARWAEGISRFVALNPADLRRSSRKSETIGERGEGLGGVLKGFRDRADGSFERTIERVKSHYPQLEAVKLRQKQAGWVEVSTVEKWTDNASEFTAAQVSDGLLRMLAVASVLESRTPPTVAMFDEIENGLHPRLLDGLIDMLRELAASGDTQIIVTTHSPIALNCLSQEENGDVVLAHRDSKGRAELFDIENHPKFAKLRNHMGIGELWYAVGDEVLADQK
jgi:predicted ATPase